MSNYISSHKRKKVTERAEGVCEYCLAPSNFAFHPFCIEHIIPISKKGTNDLMNLAFACQNCNSHKYNKIVGLDLLSKIEVPLFNPRTQIWAKHFIWTSDHTIILGLTSTGRATVQTLKMNMPAVINIRRALVSIGVHPPK